MIGIAIVLAGLTGFYAWVKGSTQPNRPDRHTSNRAFEEAIAGESSALGKALLKQARPLADVPTVYRLAASPSYRSLENKLKASNLFAGSVEVFLAYQAFTLFIASMILLALVVTGAAGATMVCGVLLAVGFGLWPYNQVSTKTKARREAVMRSLPEFAELLQMPLASGMGVLPSLSFTAERLDGPVSDEVLTLISSINTRSKTEAEAFADAGNSLGTPEANAFFAALAQAHLEGAKVIKNLQQQAEALRVAAHQQVRAKIKKMPVSMVVIMAVHLLPLLFVTALLPVVVSLGSIAE